MVPGIHKGDLPAGDSHRGAGAGADCRKVTVRGQGHVSADPAWHFPWQGVWGVCCIDLHCNQLT